jgi:hypothetical protein
MALSPRLLRPIVSGDPDARRYIEAVQRADGNTLEPGVRKAITDFVVGCKADGIWSAIKASCILMGARTLSGALVPLVGAAPTNNNFVSGDYNRATGLVGDGSTKYLDSNRNNNSEPQNSKHLAVYLSALSTIDPSVYISGRDSATFVGSSALVKITTNNVAQINIAGGNLLRPESLGFLGGARQNSTEAIIRTGGGNTTGATTSTSPANVTIKVFARGSTAIDQYSNARIAFYSIGDFLGLALLDTRVSALYTAIGTAIP